MATGRQDIFRTAAGAQPARLGEYGEAPRGGRLPGEAHPGMVRLQIADLERSTRFYRDVLGFQVLERGAGRALLAPHESERALVDLSEQPGVHPAGRRGRLGLYHFALLLPERAALGRFVRHLGVLGVNAGAGDHLVSEAFYLNDPDGLGIEVYADRPRSTWRQVNGELMMATDPVDIPDLVRAAGDEGWSGMPAGTVLGHVHLHVGDIAAAGAFYGDTLGFDRTVWSYPGALFLAAGGYHHHLGTNTWAGPGARPAAADEARLLEWTLELPDSGSVAAAGARLTAAGHPVEPEANGAIVTADPWGTRLRVQPARGE